MKHKMPDQSDELVDERYSELIEEANDILSRQESGEDSGAGFGEIFSKRLLIHAMDLADRQRRWLDAARWLCGDDGLGLYGADNDWPDDLHPLDVLKNHVAKSMWAQLKHGGS